MYWAFTHETVAVPRIMSWTPLTREEQRIVAKIARSRVEPCHLCRSTKWRPPAGAVPSTGDWVFVVRCATCEKATDVMYLSREEAAQRLNLRHGP
jgi:hypothetical protein